MNIVYKKIDDLRPAEYNPRKITAKQLEDLKASMTRFDTVEPAVVNTHRGRENVIVGGHQRIKVATDLGLKEFPCVLVDLPLEKERELNIRLNKNTGEWDFDLLKSNFELNDLTNLGFDKIDLFPKEKKQKVEFQTKPRMVKCPNCDHEFDAKEHKVKSE